MGKRLINRPAWVDNGKRRSRRQMVDKNLVLSTELIM